MSRYPDHLVVSRPDPGSPGSTGADDLYVPGGRVTVYDGSADVQDAPEDLSRGGDGTPETARNAVAFLAGEAALRDVRLDDDAEVTFADAEIRRGKVAGRRKLDGTLRLRWVR